MYRRSEILLPFLALLFLPTLSFAQSDLVCSIRANPSTAAPGDAIRLSWASVGARSASLDGIGPVMTSGSKNITAQGTQRYTLRIKNTAGRQATCTTNVTVRTVKPTCSISAIPVPVVIGSYVTISWSTTHADSVYISNLGEVQPTGSRIIRANASGNYVITARGPGGSCSLSTPITVQQPVTSSYGYVPMFVGNITNPLFGYTPNSSSRSNDTYDYDLWYIDTEDDFEYEYDVFEYDFDDDDLHADEYSRPYYDPDDDPGEMYYAQNYYEQYYQQYSEPYYYGWE